MLHETEKDVRQGLDQNVRVAVVGNSGAIIGSGLGQEIDDHDVIVRINLGHPLLSTNFDHAKDLGRRTSIWAIARYWPIEFRAATQDGTNRIWWMKLTRNGLVERAQCLEVAEHLSSLCWWDWPQALEDRCKEFVGSDPGTGLRLCWFLSQIPRPRLSIYGIDCWKKSQTSFWSGRGPVPAHVPEKEQLAMERLGLASRP